MANPEHLAILKQGVKAWNKWREKKSYLRPVLSGADLRGMDLRDAYLLLTELIGTDLSGANLRGAVLSRSNFHLAKLNHANLQHAILVDTKLSYAEIEKIDLRHARMGATVLSFLDLSTARGLETIDHRGGSSIGIETIYLSEGNIPEVFLRGCGVPEIFITFARSLVEQPIQFFSCFISHSTKDMRFCERLYSDLQAKGVRAWYFPEDAKWGEPVWGEIDRSIKVYDKLIVVCSKNSLMSGPVLREIERALNREDKEKKSLLFPITIDNYIFEEWEHPRKADVLAKVVGTEFVGWNRNAEKYDKAFRKLLKELKAD